MRVCLLFVLTVITIATAGCERRTVVVEVSATPVPEPVTKTTTSETRRLGREIDLYERESTAENKAAVKKAFADLDGEIAELEGRVARTDGRDREEANAKLKNLSGYRSGEALRFSAAEAKAPFTPAEPNVVDDRSGETKVKDSAREVGGALKDAAKNVGSAIKDAVRE